MMQYSSSIARLVTSALYKTFGWMALGLSLTAGASYLMWATSSIQRLAHMGVSIIFLFIAQFALVFALTALRDKLNYSATVVAFLAYASLTGVTLSAIFMMYEMQSIIGVFFIASSMFALVAAYGMVTKHDLSALGFFAVAALFGLIILGLVNLFIRSALFDGMLAFIGVLVFAALTAYDVQRIKYLLSEMAHSREDQNKMAITGALFLYLDFINLFLNLLRLLGKRKD